MGKKSNQNLIIGLDIGTSKVVVLVGEVTPDGKLDVVGLGSHVSHGLKRGIVVDIDSTVRSIQRAAEEAELMVGCQIHAAYTGIAGSHISSFNSHGIVAIRDYEVASNDIERVIDAAKAVAIPADQKIIHVLPQEYIIDNQDNIRQPIGMSGVRLEANVHMVTGSVSASQNIIKCVRRCGIEVADMVLEQYASSYAVLTEDEKELGVALVDIGGGTSDIAVFTEGAIRYTCVIPVAGDQVTNDIAVALRTPTQAAERIKLNYGAISSTISEDEPEMIVVQSINDSSERKISFKSLQKIITARYEELLSIIEQELRRNGFEDKIAAGIVLTGGASQLKGVIGLAEKIFNCPVRLGIPQHIIGLKEVTTNPMYATGVGLLMHGIKQQKMGNIQMPTLNNGVKGIFRRMQDWFQGNF